MLFMQDKFFVSPFPISTLIIWEILCARVVDNTNNYVMLIYELRVPEQYWGGLGLRNAASYRTILGWVRIKENCELQNNIGVG